MHVHFTCELNCECEFNTFYSWKTSSLLHIITISRNRQKLQFLSSISNVNKFNVGKLHTLKDQETAPDVVHNAQEPHIDGSYMKCPIPVTVSWDKNDNMLVTNVILF